MATFAEVTQSRDLLAEGIRSLAEHPGDKRVDREALLALAERIQHLNLSSESVQRLHTLVESRGSSAGFFVWVCWSEAGEEVIAAHDNPAPTVDDAEALLVRYLEVESEQDEGD